METSGKKVVELNIENVLPNRFQPRIKFNEEAINELSKSIKEHGVIQPIVVRPIGDKFEIIAGERRYKASCMAELKTIPAIITDLNDKDSAEVALIENVQRENLTPIEEAISYKKILDMGYITQDALAAKLGKNQSTVANKLRLLNLDDEVQEALLNEKISERHARSLLKLTDSQQQRQMLNKIITERLTVRKADEEIEKIINGEKLNEDITSEMQEETPLDIIDDQTNKQSEEPFKFIKIPEEENEYEEKNQEIIDNNETSKTEEIKPSKFFNILSEEEQQDKNQEEPKDSEEEKKSYFNNIFFNNQSQEKSIDNNALLEELNEIEKSINNSNIIKPISTEEQEDNIKDDYELDDDLEFIDEDDFEDIEQMEQPSNLEIHEQKEPEEQQTVKTSPRITNFKEVLQSVRDCSEIIEKSGYTIDTEEYDLTDTYQIIFKIKKTDN